MGNSLSKKYSRLNVQNVQQTGFEYFTEVSSVKRDARIEQVTDESFGKASNLLKKDDVNKSLFSDDCEENTDGWLTKRHETAASVAIALCNNSRVHGLDIDTTGYVDSCPSCVDVEGYTPSDSTWQSILPEVPINGDAHNFFHISNDSIFSHIRLNIAPAGGIARFRTYGQIVPDWPDKDKEYNLAAANCGASIVRWTELRNANNPNILMDNGTKMSDGWLSPRSRLGKDRNDFLVIQLATPGKLSSIHIDTIGFNSNSPSSVFIQGCYSKDTDPHYDGFNSWICLVSQSPILPGGITRFDVSGVTDEIISHIRIYIMPDGGIQQIRVIGVPTGKDKKQGHLLIEQAPERKAIENSSLSNQAEMEEVIEDKAEIEKFNFVSSSQRTTPSNQSSSDCITIVNDSQEVKEEEDEVGKIESPMIASPINLRKRKSRSSEELSDYPEGESSSKKRTRGRPKKTTA